MNPVPPGEFCNLLIEGYPPPRCTLPLGHRGVCKTTMIPEELSGVAADMLRARDDIEAERTHLHAERATLLVVLSSAMRQRRVLQWSIGLHAFGLIALTTVVIMGMTHTFAP